MAYKKYRFALVSEELYGASKPNIIEMMLDDGGGTDADATTFAGNVAALFAADVVTVDKELATNYTVPYPAGTNTEWRMVFRDTSYVVQTERLYDINEAVPPDPKTTWAALSAAGFLCYPSGQPISSVQLGVFVPTASV